MADIGQIAQAITGVYSYVDVVGIWHRHPLSEQQLRWLGRESTPLLGPPFLIRGRARFDPSYAMYTRLLQPSKAALEFIAKRSDTLLTYVEIARDSILDDDDAVQAMLETYRRHFVQRWHGKKQVRVWANGNFRTGDLRPPGLVFQCYGDKHSKVTGEVHCFHMEAKVKGAGALRRIGLNHPRDLLTFDHDELWDRHEVLFEVDRERLGRWQLNRVHGTRRQSPIVTREYNVDRSAGNIIWRASNQSVQGVVDRVGRGPFLMLSPRMKVVGVSDHA